MSQELVSPRLEEANMIAGMDLGDGDTTERWKEAKRLFEEALEVPTQERLAWLDASEAPPAIKDEVARMLRHHTETDGVLGGHIARARQFLYNLNALKGLKLNDRYVIESCIGSGGMGEVYEAADQQTGQRVALKSLRLDLTNDESVWQRFEREIQLLRPIKHPNVCPVLDSGLAAADGMTIPFYTMPLLSGQTLAARIRTDGPVNADGAKRLARDVLSGLRALHTQGIVHRDLKPSNIMLMPGGDGDVAIVMDLGIAHRAGQTTLTRTGGLVGSLPYMAPEQLLSQKVEPQADLFSLGLVIYEALTGLPLFRDVASVPDALSRTRRSTQHDLQKLDVDGPLRSFLQACLERRPSDRPPTADYALDILEGRTKWYSPRLRRRNAMWFAGALFAGVSGTALYRQFPKPEDEQLRKRLAVAEQFAQRRTADDLANAAQEYRQITKEFPNAAIAWAGLADVESARANFGFAPAREALDRSIEAAQRAVELDPDLAKAHGALGYAISIDLRRWRSAGPHFERALNLDPKQHNVRLWYASFLAKLGRFDESVAQLDMGLEQAPAAFALHQQRATTYQLQRDYTGFLRASNELTRLHPREPASHLALCHAYELNNRWDEAQRACDTAVRLEVNAVTLAAQAATLAARGKIADAKKLTAGLSDGSANVGILVTLYERLGNREKALQAIENAYNKGDSSILMLFVNERYDSVRGEPRVRTILKTLGFE